MGFYRDTIRKARKEHKCNLCGAKINIGEQYHDKAGNGFDESQIYSAKECFACQPVITEFMDFDNANEGYCNECIHEWWRDEKCYDCRKRFLPCKPDEDCYDYVNPSFGECKEKTKYGTCSAGDTCDEMTHYCRCENFEKAL